MLEPILLQPFLAIILITISCSLLGVFVLWKKLSYFGDALSHSILLGLALGALIEINQFVALVIFALIFALLVGLTARNRLFSKSTIILISSYFCISSAVIISDIWLQNFRFGNYIFGDPLTVGSQEIWALTGITIVAIIYVFYSFRKILLINLNPDLASIENIKIDFWNLSFIALLALVIALSIKIVWVFLMTALLILPAAIARIFSNSAKQMLVISLVAGTLISVASFNIANIYNLSISSSIIALLALIFFASLSLKKIRNS